MKEKNKYNTQEKRQSSLLDLSSLLRRRRAFDEWDGALNRRFQLLSQLLIVQLESSPIELRHNLTTLFKGGGETPENWTDFLKQERFVTGYYSKDFSIALQWLLMRYSHVSSLVLNTSLSMIVLSFSRVTVFRWSWSKVKGIIRSQLH